MKSMNPASGVGFDQSLASEAELGNIQNTKRSRRCPWREVGVRGVDFCWANVRLNVNLLILELRACFPLT